MNVYRKHTAQAALWLATHAFVLADICKSRNLSVEDRTRLFKIAEQCSGQALFLKTAVDIGGRKRGVS